MRRYVQRGPGRATASMAAGRRDRMRGGAHACGHVRDVRAGPTQRAIAARHPRDEHPHAGGGYGGRSDPPHRRARGERRRRLECAHRDLRRCRPRIGARTGDQRRGADGSRGSRSAQQLRTPGRPDRDERPGGHAARRAGDEHLLRRARQRPQRRRPQRRGLGHRRAAHAFGDAAGGGEVGTAARDAAGAPDEQRPAGDGAVRAGVPALLPSRHTGAASQMRCAGLRRSATATRCWRPRCCGRSRRARPSR